jgi:hypothetical protein
VASVSTFPVASNLVSIQVTLKDTRYPDTAGGEPAFPDPRVRILPEFRGQGSDRWRSMTQAADPTSEGTRGLSLGEHTFVWNSCVDVGSSTQEVTLRVRAGYEATAGDSRAFRADELTVRTDNRVGTTLLGGDLDRDPGLATFPVDLRGSGSGFVVACNGSNVLEGEGADGGIERLAGLGFAGDTVSPGSNPGTVRLPGVTGVAVDATGNLYSTHGSAVIVTNRGAAALSFGTVSVPPGTVRNGIEGLDDARCPRFHPSGALLWIDAPGGITRVAAFNPQDPGDPGATSVLVGGVSVGPGAVATVAGGGADPLEGAPVLDADLGEAAALAVGPDGEIYLAERRKGRVRVANLAATPLPLGGATVDPGTVATVMGDGTLGGTGDLGDGGPAAAARLGLVGGLEVLPGRALLVVDAGNLRLRLVNLGSVPIVFAGTTVDPGRVDTVAGGDIQEPGSSARKLRLSDPRAVAVDASGVCLVSRGQQVVAVNGGTSSVTAYGHLLRGGRTVVVYDASLRGGLPLQDPRAVHLLFPYSEEVLLTDRTTVRVLNQGTEPLTFAGVSVLPGQPAVIAGGSVEGFSGDGGPTRLAAFARPSGLATHPTTSAKRGGVIPILFVADTGNDRVRAIHLGDPSSSLPLDAFGVSVAGGTVDTVVGGAGGPLPSDGDGLAPLSASLSRPEGITLARFGAQDLLFVADTGHHRIRAVNPGPGPVTLAGVTLAPGTIGTLIGDGTPGFTADGPGPWAIDTPTALAVNGGVLCFGEAGNARIRAVNLGTASVVFALVAIPPGEMRTIAGTGVRGSGGDGDLGPLVDIDTPRGFFLQTYAGKPNALFFSDTAQHLVRVLNLNNDKDLEVARDSTGGITARVAPGSLVTIAGTPGLSGTEGDGSVPALMRFNRPWGLAWTAKVLTPATFFVADEGNDRLRAFGAPPTRAGNTAP